MHCISFEKNFLPLFLCFICKYSLTNYISLENSIKPALTRFNQHGNSSSSWSFQFSPLHTSKIQNVSTLRYRGEFIWDLIHTYLTQNSTDYLRFSIKETQIKTFSPGNNLYLYVADDKGSVLCSSVSSGSNSQIRIGYNCHLRNTWHPAFLLSTEVAFKPSGVNGQGPVGWLSCRRAP